MAEASSVDQGRIYEFARRLVFGHILPASQETMRILPDSLLYGTGLLSLITYSTPMMFLFLTVALGYIGANLLNQSATAFFPQDVPPAKSDMACIGGLYSPTTARLSLLPELGGKTSGFPSSPIFILATTIFYCISSVLQQSDVLNQLGDHYKSKIPVVIALGILLISVFMIYLIYNGCSGFMTIMFSIGAGGLLGGMLSLVFSNIFGQESINLLGLPLFVRRDKEGQPLYICAVKQ